MGTFTFQFYILCLQIFFSNGQGRFPLLPSIMADQLTNRFCLRPLVRAIFDGIQLHCFALVVKRISAMRCPMNGLKFLAHSKNICRLQEVKVCPLLGYLVVSPEWLLEVQPWE